MTWDQTRAIQTDETLNALQRRAQRDRTKAAPTPRRAERRARFGSLPVPERLAAMFTATVRDRSERKLGTVSGPAPLPEGYTRDATGALRRTTARRGKNARQRRGAMVKAPS